MCLTSLSCGKLIAEGKLPVTAPLAGKSQTLWPVSGPCPFSYGSLAPPSHPPSLTSTLPSPSRDVLTWDDHMAVMRRAHAPAFFLGSAHAVTRCAKVSNKNNNN